MTNKILLLLPIALLVSLTAFGQNKGMRCGKNGRIVKYYDVRGIRMYTEVYGTGKPLLMIHGNGGNISAFAKTIPYFAKKYQVIAVDSRAHGLSLDNRDSLSFEMMADDFDALLTAMHIDSAYVLGWSDGGISALVLAMRHPNKVIKLVSTGANLRPDSTGLIPSYWKGELKDYNNWQKKMPLITTKEKNTYKIFLLDWLQPNIPFIALHVIKCPSLIICGDHDLIPIPHTVQIYQNIPYAYLWIVPNSGHATLIEHMDEFNQTVDRFFQQPYRQR
jgi:pimeloyl-ACP methyl ester carboxylesterase